MDPSGATRRFDRLTAARQGAGVRSRRAASRGRAPDGQQDNGLGRRPCRLDERAAVAEVLAVDADHARPLVLRQRGNELRRVDVGLVPDRDRTRKAETEVLQ